VILLFIVIVNGVEHSHDNNDDEDYPDRDYYDNNDDIDYDNENLNLNQNQQDYDHSQEDQSQQESLSLSQSQSQSDDRDAERFRERRSYTPNNNNDDNDKDSENNREKDAADVHPRFQQTRVTVEEFHPCSKSKAKCVEAELHANVFGLMSKDKAIKTGAELQDLTDEIQIKHTSIKTQSHWLHDVEKILKKYSAKVRVSRKRLEGYQKDLDALKAKKTKNNQSHEEKTD